MTVTVGSVLDRLVMALDVAEEIFGVWAVLGLDEDVAGTLSCVVKLAVSNGCTV